MENDKVTRENSVSEVAHNAEDRLEDTTQAYLAQAGVGVDSRQIVSLIRDQPLKCAEQSPLPDSSSAEDCPADSVSRCSDSRRAPPFEPLFKILLSVVRNQRTTAA